MYAIPLVLLLAKVLLLTDDASVERTAADRRKSCQEPKSSRCPVAGKSVARMKMAASVCCPDRQVLLRSRSSSLCRFAKAGFLTRPGDSSRRSLSLTLSALDK